MNDDQCISIVGCGNMGLALAHRLFLSGFTVVLGSRSPDKQIDTKFEIVSTAECIRRSPIIFVAIRPENYIDSLVSCLEHESSLFNGKILIDLSNQSSETMHQNEYSNAELLQEAIPNAFVVKAFNTISSFAMQSITAGEPHNIFVASDHSIAKDRVIALAREMNFESFNAGSIRAARRLESDTKSLFPQWHVPVLFASIILFFWLTYILCMYFIKYAGTSWNQIFLNMINKALGPSVITMLAVVYMPSNLACILQLVYGTRERRFPVWLDRWMLSRKQLGLLTFALALCHAIFTITLMSPTYYSSWFHSTEFIVSANNNQTRIVSQGSFMTGTGELAALLGILTLLCMSILALTSIPAIGNLLNWREWQFVQSKLGTVTLLLAIGHVVAVGVPFWMAGTLVSALYGLSLICLYFPVLTILLKFMFWLPCFSRPLYRIRRGEVTKGLAQSNQTSKL
ncbi:unnamed protein product [Rotaria socialis]|uniref:Metalloreductase STEAP2 n=1 Tax=Rotaria socialis TaxID=392032 RepID=A0A818RGG5_9BILA|nr:unnamed protein product [Rotaria socialis]CAF4333807.1 unnamed protein product [Rotaria socialis]